MPVLFSAKPFLRFLFFCLAILIACYSYTVHLQILDFLYPCSFICDFSIFRFLSVQFFSIVMHQEITLWDNLSMACGACLCQVHFELRKWLKDNVSAEVATSTRIIYGGIVLLLPFSVIQPLFMFCILFYIHQYGLPIKINDITQIFI